MSRQERPNEALPPGVIASLTPLARYGLATLFALTVADTYGTNTKIP